MKVIPTVIERDFNEVRERVEQIKDLSQWIQVDVVDGIFTPGKTFELELLTDIEGEEKILWEIHLITKEPERWLEKCMFIGASRVVGQVEMMNDREYFVNSCKEKGLEVGLGFDIETEITKIPKETDLILLMTRKAGFTESEIDNRVFEKIKTIKKMGLTVGVDGGVNKENYQLFEKAGVDIVYCGSHYFEILDDQNNKSN